MIQALSAQDVVYRVDDALLLGGVSLSVAPGERLVLMGPNGAGKTTLLRTLAGLLEPLSGEVTLDGTPLRLQRPAHRARQIALVLAAEPMAFAWTALEVVLMGRAPWVRVGAFESADDRARAEQALARVGAAHLARRVFDALSAGERERVLLARALTQDATYLLLDEPVSHQDPAHALAIAGLTAALAAEGRAVVSVLHDLGAAQRFGERAALLRAGRLVVQGKLAEVLDPELVRQVYGVESRRVEGHLIIG